MPEIILKPNQPQFETLQWLQPNQVIAFPWGRGVGKSWWIRQCWWMLIAQWEHRRRDDAPIPFTGIRIIMLMPTLKQFKDVHRVGILDELNGEWAHLGGKPDRTTWEITFPGGSWVKPFPAKEYSAQTARGQRCDVITWDECDDIDPGVYAAVAVPWLSEPWSLKMEFGGGTPKRGRHGMLYQMHKMGLDESEENFHTRHATAYEAPKVVDQKAIERAKKTTPPAIFKREWLCDFDAAEGLIYGDLFDPKFHIRLPQPGQEFTDFILGMDHGEENPGAVYLIGVVGKRRDAIAYVLKEVYEKRKTQSWWEAKIKWLVSLCYSGRRPKLYGDPSRPMTLEQYQRTCGVSLGHVSNAVDDGIASVADLLIIREPVGGGKPFARLYISPECTNMIREFGTYRYKPDPKLADTYTNEVEKRNDHAMDALRYAIYNHIGPAPSVRTSGHLEARQ